MAFVMGFIHVPTYFAIYSVIDKETGTLSFVKECKTKGEAVEWIYKSGYKSATYCIKEYMRKK